MSNGLGVLPVVTARRATMVSKGTAMPTNEGQLARVQEQLHQQDTKLLEIHSMLQKLVTSQAQIVELMKASKTLGGVAAEAVQLRQID